MAAVANRRKTRPVPASPLSFAVTDAYRATVRTHRDATQAVCRSLWSRIAVPTPDGVDLDAGYDLFLTTMVPSLVAAQQRAVNASSGYLTAFLTSELNSPTVADTGDAQVGVSRDGRPVRDALMGPKWGVLRELKRGRDLADALRIGLNRAVRLVGMEVDSAARQSLQAGLIADDRIVGYQRAVQGTCGACLGAASGKFDPGDDFLVHPGCECYPEPVVKGVRDRNPRPTGALIFAAMTTAQQDEALGPTAAEAVRSGAIDLGELVKRARQKTTQPFITQQPDAAIA